jgi:hypothetical protein
MKQAVIVSVILMLAAGTHVGIGQTIHRLPFASTDNSIELTVANTSTFPLVGVTIEATGLPGWLRFQQRKQSIALLKAKQEMPVLFTFSVDKSAPMKQDQTISFVVSSSTGEKWTKEIKIQVAAPEKFELFQNYPNPFNPTTTISYQLPRDSRVSLKIFNLLGQEVASLVDENRLAGYHEERWDARGLASGMYIYELSVANETSDQRVARRRMILLK